MGCFVSKDVKRTKEEKLNQMILDLHREINRLKLISDRIALDNILLKEKISFLELEHKRISIQCVVIIFKNSSIKIGTNLL